MKLSKAFKNSDVMFSKLSCFGIFGVSDKLSVEIIHPLLIHNEATFFVKKLMSVLWPPTRQSLIRSEISSAMAVI